MFCWQAFVTLSTHMVTNCWFKSECRSLNLGICLIKHSANTTCTLQTLYAHCTIQTVTFIAIHLFGNEIKRNRGRCEGMVNGEPLIWIISSFRCFPESKHSRFCRIAFWNVRLNSISNILSHIGFRAENFCRFINSCLILDFTSASEV